MSKGVIEALKLLGVQASFHLKNDIEVNGKKSLELAGQNMKMHFYFKVHCL
jgi:lipoate-protein ligase A